jgi:hypothetical protein
MPRKAAVGDYGSCAVCGEHYREALRVVGARVLCRNCTDHGHDRGLCEVCRRVGPLEGHHPGGKKNCLHCLILAMAPPCPHVIPTCLNCHAVLNAWQRRWHPSWMAGDRPMLALLQGLRDVWTLALERCPDHLAECADAMGRLRDCLSLLAALDGDVRTRLDDLVDPGLRP